MVLCMSYQTFKNLTFANIDSTVTNNPIWRIAPILNCISPKYSIFFNALWRVHTKLRLSLPFIGLCPQFLQTNHFPHPYFMPSKWLFLPLLHPLLRNSLPFVKLTSNVPCVNSILTYVSQSLNTWKFLTAFPHLPWEILTFYLFSAGLVHYVIIRRLRIKMSFTTI